MSAIADGLIVFLLLGMVYALMSEGLWGAALMFFNVLFSALIALNFYEPVAGLLASNVSQLSGFADTLCLLLIFGITAIILRITTDSVAPVMVRFPMPLYHLGRIVFAVGGGCVTMAILILGLECAPVDQKVLNSITYQSKPPFGLGLDHRFLAFFQQQSGSVFSRHGTGYRDPFGQYGDARVFDPEARWLIDHQEARPYGDEPILGTGGGGSEEGESSSSEGGGETAQGNSGRPGPGIPGGTAGAAVGLAPTEGS